MHFSWVFVFGLMSWLLATGYFPHVDPNHVAWRYWVEGMLAALLLFACVALHELAHCLIARRLGVDMRSITLFALGGVAEMRTEPRRARDELKIAAAGPLASLALGVILYAGFLLGRRTAPSGVATAICQYVALLNVSLAGFNLIPALPLDGGRIFRSLLWWRAGDLKQATDTAALFARGFACVLIATGGLMIVVGWVGGVLNIFLGLFLVRAVRAEQANVAMKETLRGVRVGDLMLTNIVVLPADLTIREATRDYFLRHGWGGFPVLSSGRVVGLLTGSDVQRVPAPSYDRLRVSDVMLPLSREMTVDAASDAGEARRNMITAGWDRMLVVEDGRLVGVITRANVEHYLQFCMNA